MNGRAGGFGVDADRLGAQAAEFAELADRAGRIVAELHQVLDATGPAWGSDAVGDSFAASHAAPAAGVLGRLDGLATGLTGIGTRFADAATAYRAADEDAAGNLSGAESAG